MKNKTLLNGIINGLLMGLASLFVCGLLLLVNHLIRII